jgi:hypothetical protein
MKNLKKELKKILQTLKRLINSYGGNSSLTCPSVIAQIQEELTFFHRDINDEELAFARKKMNSLKSKNSQK